MRIGAQTILDALAVRHAKDVFVPECKDGASMTRVHRRLDAWVLASTWSPVTMIGYEIKVSRQDFVRDQKLTEYLPVCNLLYVVAPKGVVEPRELPEGVGLIEALGHGQRLVTRCRAPRREIEPPANLLVYVLMARTRVTRERWEGHALERREWLQAWLAEKDNDRRLCEQLHRKIRSRFDEQEQRQHALNERVGKLEHIERRIRELGFDPAKPVSEWQVADRVRKLREAVAPDLLHEMGAMSSRLDTLRRQLCDLLQPEQDNG